MTSDRIWTDHVHNKTPMKQQVLCFIEKPDCLRHCLDRCAYNLLHQVLHESSCHGEVNGQTNNVIDSGNERT